MSTYVQADRLMTVTTPLGPDALLLVGFSGHEAVSQLFGFQLELMAEHATEISFSKVLGQKITVHLRLPGGNHRHFSGICNRLAEVGRDPTFTHYRMDVVPHFWLLTRRFRSRIFQHLSVPDILKEVLDGLDVQFEILGTFHPRDYCVQYNETDFNFASRLMEEEGIYYYFRHTEDGHRMVVANTPQSHADLPEPSELIFEHVEGGEREEDRIVSWEKMQELRSGKYTLRDYSFELPGNDLMADSGIGVSVAAGKDIHNLMVGGNEKLELYEWPGTYADRFDGVSRTGADQPAEIQKIFEDSRRTVKIRMEQEEVHSMLISGASNCRHLVSGHKFTLKRHPNADDQYLLTSVQHIVRVSSYRSGMPETEYTNTFTCIPYSLVFRPSRLTPKPLIYGTQTAMVVGPDGEEIFTDKYGRVKVQFHWDRGQDAGVKESSCWIRVATAIAGRGWGTMHIPRMGQEVVVAFEDGDPDRPIIVGSVYNADDMPAYKLPDHKVVTGFKSYSSPGGGGFNEIRFNDTKGKEQMFIHGQYDQDVRILHDRREWIGRDRHLVVKRDKRQHIGRDHHCLVNRDLVQQVDRDHHVKITGKHAVRVGGSCSVQADGDVACKFGQNHTEQTAMDIYLKAGKNIVLEAGVQISLKVGGNFVDVGPAGVAINGTAVLINSGGAPAQGVAGNLVPPTEPAIAEIADNADPGSKAASYKSQRAALPPAQVAALDAPTHDPGSDESKAKKHWIEIELVDKQGKPVPGEAFRITLPDGTTLHEGVLDEKGFARVDGIDPGTCKVTFPKLDKNSWKRK